MKEAQPCAGEAHGLGSRGTEQKMISHNRRGKEEESHLLETEELSLSQPRENVQRVLPPRKLPGSTRLRR